MTARILLVGHGNRGGMWGRIIAARTDTVLSAIVEPSPEAAARARAAHPGVPIVTRLQAGLAYGAISRSSRRRQTCISSRRA